MGWCYEFAGIAFFFNDEIQFRTFVVVASSRESVELAEAMAIVILC